MKETQRTEIFLETHETTIIRWRRNQSVFFCRACRARVPHLPVNQADSIFSIPAEEIRREAEAGRIHLNEAENGLLMLCRNSLVVLSKHNTK